MTERDEAGRTSAGVTYTARAFKRGFGSGKQPLQLQAAGDASTLAAFQDVLGDCRQRWRALEGVGYARGWISEAIAAPNGPLCRLQPFGFKGPIEAVLDEISTGLTDRGIVGVLRPARAKLHPVFKGGTNGYFSTLSAVVTLPVDLDRLYADTDSYARPRYGWLVEAELTRHVLKTAIEWCLDGEGDTYLSGVIESTPVAASAESVLGFLADAPEQPERLSYMFGVKQASPHRMRYVGTDRYGLLTLQEVDLRADQRPALADLVTITDALAPHGWTTSIRQSATGLTGWEAQPAQQNHRSPIDAAGTDRWRVLHLLPDYVLDAYVHQVLTTNQLAKTILPPERWTITPLGNDRHAVSAVDPEPWLNHSDLTQPISADNRPTGVNPATLEQARLDFGGAIINPATLALHPPPMPDQLYATYLNHQQHS
ncbi:hypothetical protein [Nocardioides sp. WS12]|uniref:hypothetical protein n=1 Tax=Nocardioides sp. WS12 TaxID=2486272 RepID=UPI0015FC39A5|nr:hypothetical protein [Nocardioides sp. WS12]